MSWWRGCEDGLGRARMSGLRFVTRGSAFSVLRQSRTLIRAIGFLGTLRSELGGRGRSQGHFAAKPFTAPR